MTEGPAGHGGFRRGRRIGVDVGDARIGVASSDPDGMLATPVETVPAGPGSLARLVALAEEYQAVEVVVGLPRSLSGNEGPAAVTVVIRSSTSRTGTGPPAALADASSAASSPA